MIYCIAFGDIREHLKQIGFREVRAYEGTVRFARGSELLTVKAPNVDGHVPEVLINDAFYAAGLDPPEWRVFWCD